MLKSRFNLKVSDSEENVEEEQREEPGEEKKKDKKERRRSERTTDEEIIGDEATPKLEEYSTPLDQPVFVRKLHKSEISLRLSMIGKIGEGDGYLTILHLSQKRPPLDKGLPQRYSYLKAVCTGMKLTDISLIKCFKHLQFVNVSNNLLTTAALQDVMDLPFLVLLQADANLVTSAKLKRGKYLQILMLNHNHITSVYDVYHRHLSTLEVGSNKLEIVKFENHMPELKSLNLRENLIRDISHFEFTNLVHLYIAANHIKSLIGLETMRNLKTLHARSNPIRKLDGFTSALANLQYLNLRNCKISSLFQIKKLRVLPALETLIIKNCPFMGGTGKEIPKSEEREEDPLLRIEVIAAMLHLKRLNKQNVTPEERIEAKETAKQWLEDGEKDEEDEEFEEEEIPVEEQTELSEEVASLT